MAIQYGVPGLSGDYNQTTTLEFGVPSVAGDVNELTTAPAIAWPSRIIGLPADDDEVLQPIRRFGIAPAAPAPSAALPVALRRFDPDAPDEVRWHPQRRVVFIAPPVPTTSALSWHAREWLFDEEPDAWSVVPHVAPAIAAPAPTPPPLVEYAFPGLQGDFNQTIAAEFALPGSVGDFTGLVPPPPPPVTALPYVRFHLIEWLRAEEDEFRDPEPFPVQARRTPAPPAPPPVPALPFRRVLFYQWDDPEEFEFRDPEPQKGTGIAGTGPPGTVPALREDALLYEYSYTTGTGTYALAGAYGSYFRFNHFYMSAEQIYYRASDESGQAEIALGTFDPGGNTLTRDVILISTNSNNPVDWSGATRVLMRALCVCLHGEA